jgi:hypothetical protein
MRTFCLRLLVGCVVVVAPVSWELQAQTKGQIEAAMAALGKVDGAELPSRAAGLVAGAPGEERIAVAAAVGEAAARMNPGMVLAVVSAVSARVPEAAAAVAAASAAVLPRQAASIAVAAVRQSQVRLVDVRAAVMAAAPAQAAQVALALAPPATK